MEHLDTIGRRSISMCCVLTFEIRSECETAEQVCR